METPWIVVRPGDGLSPGWEAKEVGRKALGLAGLPTAWCPPFVVVTTAAYRRWAASAGGTDDASWLFAEAGLRAQIDHALKTQPKPLRMIVRSSAPDEGLEDRGRYESAVCLNNDAAISHTISRLWAECKRSTSGLALIVQPHIDCVQKGHLSNERRLVKSAREWVYEYEGESQTPTARRIVAGEGLAPTDAPLTCTDRPALLRQLASVAAVGTLAWGRVHYEWVWDDHRLWLVQQDVEEPKVGHPPGNLNPRSTQQAISNFDVLVSSDRSLGPWHKVDCVRIFRECGLRVKPVYVVEGDAFIRGLADDNPDPRLLGDIRRLATSPIVVRTGVDEKTGYPSTLLPRTDCVDAIGAVKFLSEHARKLINEGLAPNQFCFLLHNYVSAKAASLSRATPGSEIVSIDATWGNADGLLYYPHDTFEVTLGKRPRIRTRIRCKERFIDYAADGRWAEREAGIPWDWEPAISRADAINIALATKTIADRLGHAVEVMHFVGVDAGEASPICLPWFYSSESKDDGNRAEGLPSISIFSKDVITIRTDEDLNRAAAEARLKKPSRGCTLQLIPKSGLLRNEKFIAEVSKFAVQYDLPVRLVGSTLSHVFYVLRRNKVKLKIPTPSRQRSRRRRFNKLVRDKIPQIIRGQGEVARVARVQLANHPDLVKAKLIEEAFELYWEHEPNGLRREMADLLEVMRAICAVIGISFEEVTVEAERRREERGGFESGNILLETSTRPAQTPGTLFDDVEEVGTEDDVIVKRPAPEEPKGTKTGLSIPLVPPNSNHSQGAYRVRSGDGSLDVLVSYSGRKVFVRPVESGRQVKKPSVQGSLFDTSSPDQDEPHGAVGSPS